ncbi:NAD(P)/FAD-dependent oxidoreductase [Micromonospora globispora]|nr:FAD-dependent oxidoreductase [Micromonospora globispora]
MAGPDRVVIVGESVAGITAARELRTRGYTGRLVVLGNDPHGSYARPALSKSVLKDLTVDISAPVAYDDLDLNVVRRAATHLDLAERKVSTEDGDAHPFDAAIIATGATPRRLAEPSQRGELVLRTLDDAQALHRRLDEATSTIVIGAGFLGMEVPSACASKGVDVTVVDVVPPLRRLFGPFLSWHVARLATAHGVRYVKASGSVRLLGQPVAGIILDGGATLTADVVVSCVGDVPAAAWLGGTGIADQLGVPVDSRCATPIPGVFAAGDVTYLRSGGYLPNPTTTVARRRPFWCNAVAQGKVVAASVLGEPADTVPFDDYFWTELFGVHVKVAGPLLLDGDPGQVDGSIEDGDALLRWDHPDGRVTAVAFGRRIAVSRLRALASSTAD